MKQALPALILLALLQATTPALARGLVPVCSASGTIWVDLNGRGAPVPDSANACAHGWCTPRKLRTQKGA
ncbi:hypothetical protein FJQ54_16140 [Sandaracinobacter neustonicus]|uniref:Secreted protein n=1 Tax=Sandaracinobacter neustonicus TaxID=1715348 RepID=A0A501XE36_9SPHN|nr:hypothetical protein [Sandaracinobacter neustonicus]TPE58587.1 hypothetical protein FJQ54_16140 [Sandaracinobacter neustonicus]